MKQEERRRFKRYPCNIPLEYYLYSSKIKGGQSKIQNVSKGGLMFPMKTAPFPDTVIVVKIDSKKIAKYVDFNTILLDTDGNPIGRVTYVSENKRRKAYEVGVRFLEKPRTEAEKKQYEQRK
ncbi:MAG: PilZ domain-containing protein [Candidatus Omnitrophica bacterium]|nr:PilZ domain-containing protein [Candidatus Omnitrophota bacterium]